MLAYIERIILIWYNKPCSDKNKRRFSVDIFLPKLFLDSVYDITVKLLADNNIKGLILDLDNTLVAQYIERPDQKLIDWINSLKKNAIKLCIVSNGSGKRVRKFNESLGLDVVAKAKKPCKKGFKKALDMMNLRQDEVAVVGDQLFTDIWGGNRLGMFTILVRIIDKREEFFVRLKRYPEKLVFMLSGKSHTL